MCLAVPGRILRCAEGRALVDFGGVQREILLDLLPGVQPGDWVLAHAGFAIQALSPEDARETLDLFADLADAGVTPDPAATP